MAEKHIPLRMCVVTREMLPKAQLIRLIKTEDGLMIDKTLKMQGRGFWISKKKEVIELAKKKKVLNKVLHKEVREEFYNLLEDYISEN